MAQAASCEAVRQYAYGAQSCTHQVGIIEQSAGLGDVVLDGSMGGGEGDASGDRDGSGDGEGDASGDGDGSGGVLHTVVLHENWQYACM